MWLLRHNTEPPTLGGFFCVWILPVTPKQVAFVDEYLIDLNATQAAIRAGYSAKTAGWIGPQLLGKTHISEAIAIRMGDRQKRTEITQDLVLTDK